MTTQTQDLKGTISAFLAAIDRGDVNAIVGFYADDSIVQPPVGDVVQGKPALNDYWNGIVTNYPMSGLSYRSIALQPLGPDFVSELTEFEGSSGGVEQKGRYCQIWRRESGGWKLLHDTYNIMLPN